MFMMKLTQVTVLLALTSTGQCSVQDSDTIYQNSLSALLSPSLCQLKLICAITKSGNSQLQNSKFMQGITVLAGYRGDRSVNRQLEEAIRTGEAGKSCRHVAPDCHHSGRELLSALQDMDLENTEKHSRERRQTYTRYPYRRRQPWYQTQATYSPFRRQGAFSLPSLPSLSHMPPVFRPDRAGRRQVCRTCDQRSHVCTVYSVGTYAGCAGVWLVAGPPGQLACNVATAPGSIGCGMNTLHCYMSGCGLINLPRLP